MDAKELRIGNYIYRMNEIHKVAASRFVVLAVDLLTESSIYKPIPLTEEWLLKMGFASIQNSSYINGRQWFFQVTDEYIEDDKIICRDGTWFDGIGTYTFTRDGAMSVNILCRGNYVCNSISTVHQLQNLYFAFTGTELEIK